MWTIVFHLAFMAFLVLLVFAMARQGESMELLVKGLDTARKADAEAARMRLALMQEEQRACHNHLVKLLNEANAARARTDTLIRSGKGHNAGGHRG